MKTLVKLGTCSLVALAVAACQEQPTSIPDGSSSPSLAVAPAGGSPLSELGFNEFSLPAIDGTLYQCEDTDFVPWFLDQVFSAFDPLDDYFTIFSPPLWGDYVAFDYAYLYGEPGKSQYFGYDGQFTNQLNRTNKDARRFWDIDSSDIKLLGAHGDITSDLDKMTMLYEAYGYGPFAPDLAQQMVDLVTGNPALNDGDYPVFTLNAFAVPAPANMIIMGDGILHFYEDIGYGDVAPQAIFAHEFAHHIQFANGYFDDDIASTGGAESTRYTELMADAMAAYFLTHKRGATMNRKRVEQFLAAFYQIGDCSFSSSGHHGTPNQRMAAAQFGFDIADQAQKQGHILTSQEFYELFVAAYPDLIAPDAI